LNRELDADAWGFFLVMGAGYDPYGSAGALGKLDMLFRHPGLLGEWFDDISDPHTSLANRIDNLQVTLGAVCNLNSEIKTICNELRCTPLSRQKLDLLKVLSLPGVFIFTSENEKPVGPVVNVEKSRCFLRDFSKSLWESALFADFHRDGIFHRPYASAFKIRTLILSVFALAA
jgi:hypothetical protein